MREKQRFNKNLFDSAYLSPSLSDQLFDTDESLFTIVGGYHHVEHGKFNDSLSRPSNCNILSMTLNNSSKTDQNWFSYELTDEFE